jgi:hypothetical protein
MYKISKNNYQYEFLSIYRQNVNRLHKLVIPIDLLQDTFSQKIQSLQRRFPDIPFPLFSK